MALPSLVAVLLLLAVTSRVLADTCPEREAIASFDSSAFLGRWYTLKHTAIEGNRSWECLSMLVKPVGEQTHRLSTHTRFVRHATAAIHVELGVLFKEDNSSTSGKYLHSRRMSATESNKKYYILDTDYRNYAVTWYCVPSRIAGRVTEVYAVVSRQASLDQELAAAAERRLPDGSYVEVSHERCPTIRVSSESGHGSTEELESDSTSAEDP